MKRFLRWLAIILGGLVMLLILAALGVFILSNGRINQRYDFAVAEIAIPSDADSLAQGEHIAITRGCIDCHGEDLGGDVFLDEAPAFLYASNLTSGQGGIGASYSDTDWVRAIRHGVGADGTPLLFMPSHEYYFLGDADLGALIAYLKSLPAIDREPQASQVRPLGRVLLLAGQFPLLPAELIDHTAPRPTTPEVGVTVEYGQYLAVGCTGCHGEGYSGGVIPGVPPEWPPAANLTPGGRLATWGEADFINTLRTGVTPENHQLNPQYMPWPQIAAMTDEELKAMWLFFQSLPAQETGNR